MQPKDEPDSRSVSRRRLLRGAGVAAAGVAAAGAAGAVVAGAVAATPAQAAAGDPVLQGAVNTAGATTTTLTANPTADKVTLELANTTQAPPDVNNLIRGGATLRLTPNGDLLSDTAPPGSMGMTTDGTLWIVPALSGGQPFRTFVYTDGNANLLVPLTPARVIDTRDPAQRGRIFNPSALDGQGRLIGGQRIDIDLSEYSFSAVAAFVNITAVAPVAAGFMTAFPTGTSQPTTSNVNYASNVYAWPNYAVSPVGTYTVTSSDVRDAISIFASATVHVIVDLAAVQAPSTDNVNPAHRMAVEGAHAAPAQLPTRPAWAAGN